MLTNKDIRVENGNLVLNGDKYPLASQAEIDAVKEDIDDLGDTIGDITQTGITGASVAAQLAALKTAALKIGLLTSASVAVKAGWRQFVEFTLTNALPTNTVAIFVIETASPLYIFANFAEYDSSNLKIKIGVWNTSNEEITGTYKVAFLYTE